MLIQHENEEQLRLEEILKTPENVSRLDGTLPRNRRRPTDTQGQLVASLICTYSFMNCDIDGFHLFLRCCYTKTDVVTHWISHFPLIEMYFISIYDIFQKNFPPSLFCWYYALYNCCSISVKKKKYIL